jgi:hypothetical protein
VHLVSFIIRIYHDAQSSECQKRRLIFTGCDCISRLMLFVAWYEETTVFEHSNTEIVGSNYTRSVNVYPHFFFVLSCVG